MLFCLLQVSTIIFFTTTFKCPTNNKSAVICLRFIIHCLWTFSQFLGCKRETRRMFVHLLQFRWISLVPLLWPIMFIHITLRTYRRVVECCCYTSGNEIESVKSKKGATSALSKHWVSAKKKRLRTIGCFYIHFETAQHSTEIAFAAV